MSEYALVTVLWKRAALRNDPQFRRVLLLLGVCMTARLRRLFEGVEWFHFLLELPVYLLVLQLLLRNKERNLERGLRLVHLTFLILGGYAYFRLGRGPLTQHGGWEAVQTPRGVYRMPAAQANDFLSLQARLVGIDPGGERPLFAFGYSGGFNYFLNRPNATPLSQGFLLANAEPIEVVAALKHGQHAPILIDNRAYDRIGVPVSRLSWDTWEIPTKRVHYWRFDRTYFDLLKSGCLQVNASKTRRPMFTLYDCAHRP